MRETEIISAVTDMRGDIVVTTRTPLHARTPESVVREIATVYRSFSADRPIDAIGIGVGGAVTDRRVITSADHLGWADVPLAQLVENATHTATLVENDVVALCEYEDWFGFARHDARFAVVTLGIGTGFGLVVEGQPIVNDDYGKGLVEHWPMDATGPLCARGHRGCASALLASEAIARYATEAIGKETSFERVLELASSGQPAARRIVDDAARGLGVLLAAICNLALPDRIIVAGEGVGLAAVGSDPLRQTLLALRDPRTSTPPIDLASGDNTEWARGAAVLAIQAFALGRAAPISPRPA